MGNGPKLYDYSVVLDRRDDGINETMSNFPWIADRNDEIFVKRWDFFELIDKRNVTFNKVNIVLKVMMG